MDNHVRAFILCIYEKTCFLGRCAFVINPNNNRIQYRLLLSKELIRQCIATKVVCFSRLLKCLGSLYGKQCGPRPDCSYRSSLFWVHAVCFYTLFVSNARQLFAADDYSRQHFQMQFFGALRVKSSLFWVHAICFYNLFVSNARQLFAADDYSRRHFQMHFFLGALRVKKS